VDVPAPPASIDAPRTPPASAATAAALGENPLTLCTSPVTSPSEPGLPREGWRQCKRELDELLSALGL
jgi:hypothetical protein